MVSPEFIAILAFILAVVILLGWILRLELKLQKILRGKDAKTLEDTIVGLTKDAAGASVWRAEMEKYLKTVESRLTQSVRGIETTRFNAFSGDGTGGNQSFATAFLNESGDGAVISSIYSRDRMSVFSKPIKKFTSEYELSEEERKVIELSKKSIESRG